MAERQICEKTGSGETHPPPLSAEKFMGSPEFRKFRAGIKRLLKVPKAELDKRVAIAREASPRSGNPNAPGRKPMKKHGEME
jgi:hypothetical protein